MGCLQGVQYFRRFRQDAVVIRLGVRGMLPQGLDVGVLTRMFGVGQVIFVWCVDLSARPLGVLTDIKDH